MKNRRIFLSGILDECEQCVDGTAILYLNESKHGHIKFNDVPNLRKVEVIVLFYQKIHDEYVVSHRGVLLSGHLHSYAREQRGRAIINLNDIRVGDICYKDINGVVELIVPLDQRLKEPKDTTWYKTVDFADYVYLINKHEVLAVVSASRWTLRVGPDQHWNQVDNMETGKKAVIESLAVKELGGYKYENT